MERVSFDGYEDFISGLLVKEKGGFSNGKQRNSAKNAVLEVMKNELSEKQKEYIILFFFEHKNMTQIAKEKGINKATVSRTIKRGLTRMRNVIKYYSLR